MSDIKPHPLNAPGVFYVEDGCCTACEVPFSEAPALFKYDDSDHCYVSRQPSTSEETSGMLSAIACADLQCIRYRGTDAQILDRLAAMGETEICDNPPSGFQPRIRNHVTFKTSAAMSLPGLVALFAKFLEQKTTDSFSYKIKGPHFRDDSADLKFATRLTLPGIRHKGAYDTVIFQSLDASSIKGDFCAYHEDETSPGISSILHRWLADSDDFKNVLWFTKNEWFQNDCAGHEQPW